MKEHAEIKGTGFNSTIKSIRATATPERFAAFLAALTPATRALVSTPPHAASWLNIACIDDAMRTAFSVAHANDEAATIRQGSVGFSGELHGIYRTFLKMLSPEFTARRLGTIWNLYYRHNGLARVLWFDAAHGKGAIRFENIVIPSRGFWLNQLGTLIGTLQATRARDPHVWITEGGHDEASCTMEARWLV